MTTQFHEGKVLDAVLRRIEARDSVARGADVRSPENERHPAPIDLACSLGGRLFAFEHTGIEPFARQIEMERHNEALFGDIPARLEGVVPKTESYRLEVPVEATAGLKRADLPAIKEAILNWTAETGPTIAASPYGRLKTPARKVRPPGVPFDLTLYRFSEPGPMGGHTMLSYIVSGDYEAARLDRLREACGKKFGKLHQWKRQHGAHTVLVLEDADMFLTNHQRVADAFALAEKDMADKPDEVFVVSTYLEKPWWVTCLRREGKTYYDDGERFWEVDSADLVQLTDR